VKAVFLLEVTCVPLLCENGRPKAGRVTLSYRQVLCNSPGVLKPGNFTRKMNALFVRCVLCCGPAKCMDPMHGTSGVG